MADNAALELEGRAFTDANFKAIRSLDRVEMLALLDTSITDDGFAELQRARSLVHISITSNLLSSFALDVLSRLPSLRSLLVHRGPRIGDEGLRHLSKCSELRELCLKETAISDKGLSYISELPNVWSLILDDTGVTDDGCATLAGMSDLSLLSLNRTRVTGHALARLRDNEHFNIYLEETPATDDAVIALADELSNLTLISLSDTRVGDTSARALAPLQHLNDVRLSGTRITDVGLAAFNGHPYLDVVYVERCEVSSAAVQAVKKASPRRLTVYGP